MSTISPKQIDWSQSISGSLIPYTSGSNSSSEYSLGSISASWNTAYVDTLNVDNIDIDNLQLQTLVVSQSTELKNSTVISGSVKISGSLEVDGVTTLRSGLLDTSSLNVEGQLNIINQQINSSVERAKITIQNLGEVGNRDDDLVLDLGGFF